MRCRFCGSKSLHADKQHKTFSGGKAVAGTVVFGVVGAAAGFIGKDKDGYRCGACGAFMEAPMQYLTEDMVNSAIEQAKSGKQRSRYDYFKAQYPNIEEVPLPTVTAPSSVLLPSAISDRSLASAEKIEHSDEDEPSPLKRQYFYGYWQPDCPIYIDTVYIRTGPQGDLLALNARNQDARTIRSAYYQVTVYDDTGDEVSSVRCVYQNISTSRGWAIPDSVEFALNTDLAYRVDIACEKIAFENGDVWRAPESLPALPVIEQELLTDENFPRLNYAKPKLWEENLSFLKTYMPVDHGENWQCACRMPVKKGEACHFELHGSKTYADLMSILSQENLQKDQQDVVRKRAAKRAQKTIALYQAGIEKPMQVNYDNAVVQMEQNTPDALERAIALFEKYPDFKDAKQQIAACETKLNQSNYDDALALMQQGSVDGLTDAIALLEKNPDFEDSREQIAACKEKLPELREAEEKARIAAEKKAEEERVEAARLQAEKEAQRKAHKKKIKKFVLALATALVAIIAVALVLIKIVIPNNKYNKALSLQEAGKYEEAFTLFDSLGEYKDSESQAINSKNAMDYAQAKELFENGQYEDAGELFDAIGTYNDSEELYKLSQYKMAESLLSYGANVDYSSIAKARDIFIELGDYKDSQQYLSQIYCVCTSIDGGNIEYVYDEYGRNIANGEVYNDEGLLVKDATYTYEYSNGLLVKRYSPTSEYRYDYNLDGTLSGYSNSYNGASFNHKFEYTYDSNNRLAKSIVTTYKDSKLERIISTRYTYDSSGNLIRTSSFGEPDASHPSGYNLEGGAAGRTFSYNEEGYLETVDFLTYRYAYIWAPKHDDSQPFYYQKQFQSFFCFGPTSVQCYPDNLLFPIK